MTKPRTRIQERNRAAIMEAALDVFSQYGFRGARLDQIAEAAGLSKPNLLYYFKSKEEIHVALLSGLMETWLAPLSALNHDGEPVEEIISYVLRKLEMSREMPRESRLFANEVIQGAPRIIDLIAGDLRSLVMEKSAVIQDWVDQGHLAPVDPVHLIFSIWATTQHYADFDIQIRGVLQPKGEEHFKDAAKFLEDLFRRTVTP